jgi:hypothetical protein
MADATEGLVTIYGSQSIYKKTNGKYATSFDELGFSLKPSGRGYLFGFNPKCSTAAPHLDKETDKLFGAVKKTYFSTWLAKQPCRTQGFIAYAVKPISNSSYEVHEINELKQIKIYNL